MTDVIETLGLDTVIKRREDLVAQEMDGELVMLDMRSGQYFGLDSVASAIWQRIEEPVSIQQLCTQLEEEYDVSHHRCADDVLTFLAELNQKELVELQ